MKKYILMFLLITSPIVIIDTGCKTQPTAQGIVYNTIASIAQSVDAGMKLAAEKRAKEMITQDRWNQIAKVYDDYRVVLSAAITLSKGSTTVAASDELTKASTAVLNLVNNK